MASFPLELLDIIFNLTLPEESDPALMDDYLKAPLTLSQVCLRWRAAALLNSRLWNQVFLKGRSWRKAKDRLALAKELVVRSRGVPVSLYAWIGEGWDENLDHETATIIETVMPRLRVLELRVNCLLLENGSMCVIMDRLRNSHAPLLEAFSMAPFNSHKRTTYSSFKPFFNKGAPKLQRLDFAAHLFTLHPPTLSNITHFRLHNSVGSTIARFTCTYLLKVLRKMPLLEDLFLSLILDAEDETADENQDDNDQLDDIKFSHLKYLYLELCDIDCAILLGSLTLPPGCLVDILCNDAAPNTWYHIVLDSLENRIEECKHDMSDKALCLDIHASLIQVAVRIDPRQDVNTEAQIRPCLTFTFVLKNSDSDDEEDNENVDVNLDVAGNVEAYTMLLYLARFLNSSKLVAASSLHLGIYTRFYLETLSAPLFGPLIRACTQAERLVLTGTENEFLFPVTMWIASARRQEDLDWAKGILRLDDLLFKEVPQGQRWDPLPLLQLSHEMGIYTYPLSLPAPRSTPNVDEPPLFSKRLSIVNFLHAEYDLGKIDVFYELPCALLAREKLAIVAGSLTWPVCSESWMSCEGTLDFNITMRDMMRHYLKPPKSLSGAD
ncbi:unnamed protein product [Cyclocybe aegerita]|uniref:F-box domain-containing protein n=1 Tax=Cyclocybe aegerita TaxID=1973307 RepID=A0A8S0WS92_CYCAE|nr:unnamed protein product [Cyclocybe aegerita]